MDRKPWEQLPEETSRAYKAFKAFLDAGPGRESLATYRNFTGKKAASGCPPGYWSTWLKAYNWYERARAYDAEIDRKLHEETIESRKKEHAAKLEQFRKAHEQLGIGGLEVSMRATKVLADWLKENPKITNFGDASRAVQLVQIASQASQAWADALGVKTLLDQLDVTQDGG